MPFTLPLTVNNVFLRAGLVRETFNLPNQLRLSRPFDAIPQFGVLIHWPRELNWLTLSADVFPDTGGTGTQFSNTAGGLNSICDFHGTTSKQVATPSFVEANSFLIGSTPRANRFILNVAIDTDSPGFQELANKPRSLSAPSLVVVVNILFFDGKQFKTFVTQSGQIQFTLLPCSHHPRFEGSLAVDLGNTFTTVASVAINNRNPVHLTSSIELLPIDIGGSEGTNRTLLPSVIWLNSIHTSTPEAPGGKRLFPSLPDDELLSAIRFATGHAAILGSQGELPEGAVFGIKQLLSVPEPDEIPHTFDANITHVSPDLPQGQVQTVAVLNRLPGELLFTHVFQTHRDSNHSWPADLVLTYPTTYSRRELNQLARAAARGWLRAMNERQSFGTPPDRFTDPEVLKVAEQVRMWLSSRTDHEGEIGHSGLIHLAVDEASAAAFFHIYRRVLEQPGGARRFRYLCPAGLRTLIVDCGGGTTDVALVRAQVSTQANDVSQLNLEIDVLARSGVRDFGGDHITREVCRLIKSKITLLSIRTSDPARLRGGMQDLPQVGPTDSGAALKQVEGFLTKVADFDREDKFVPTRFSMEKMDVSTPRRRMAFHSLWQMGNALKAKLGEGKLGERKLSIKLREVGRTFFQAETSPLIAEVVRHLEPGVKERLAAQIQEITISRWEVDALVRERIHALIKKCNRLIEKKLGPGDGCSEEEVDWVVLSGNGARYPLFEELLKAQLDVAYLDDPSRFTFDPENMKHAVAKGAVMARISQRVSSSVPIRFNRNLSKLLPYDILWHDARGNEPRLLFEEFTPYQEIADNWKPLTGWRSHESNQPITLILERRFPGDDLCSRYAGYQFPEGLSEPMVRYDPYNERFEVYDAKSQLPGQYTDLTDAKEHRSPASQGDF